MLHVLRKTTCVCRQENPLFRDNAIKRRETQSCVCIQLKYIIIGFVAYGIRNNKEMGIWHLRLKTGRISMALIVCSCAILQVMGCNNSHLRPFFRRCRRRSKKDDSSVTPKNDLVMIEHGNHCDGGNGGSTDILEGLHFLGSSAIRNPANKQQPPLDSQGLSESPFCVPLLAQS